MNRPNKPLTLELLDEALCATLQEKHPYPFDRLLLNEKGWRHVFEREPIASRWLRGLPVELLPADQLLQSIQAVQFGRSIDDDSAILMPEAKYGVQGILEVDFRFETTQQIENVLRGGTVVIPEVSAHQYWQTVTVRPGKAAERLMDLMRDPRRGNGCWYLRRGMMLRAHDGVLTISCHGASSGKSSEIASLLSARYKVRIDTAIMDAHVRSLQSEIATLDARKRHFEYISLQAPKNFHEKKTIR